MRTIDDMVHQEVIYCVSCLVSDLMALEPIPGEWANLAYNAQECEECDGSGVSPGDPDDLCNECDSGMVEREIYEHWIVSNWLADKLEAAGETVERDFHGLTIWGRTTTGQSIAMDWIIEQIYRQTHRKTA